jgi:hypothetical protein
MELFITSTSINFSESESEIFYWDITPCNVVETDWRFRGDSALIIMALAGEAVGTTETSAKVWEIIPEDSHIR